MQRICPTCSHMGSEQLCPLDRMPMVPAARGTWSSVEEPGIVGRRLAERWDVLDLVATTSSGWLYRGRHVTLRHNVIIKIARSPDIAQLATIGRFYSELAAAERLKQTNTLRIQTFGVSDDGLPYVIMEHKDGRLLSEMFGEVERLTPSRAVHLARQLAASLDEAHEHGVMHLDLGPHTIRVLTHQESDFAKIFDYGLTGFRMGGDVHDPEDENDWVVSLPETCSPEQAQNLLRRRAGRPPELLPAVTKAADLYSLGALVYRMLTGEWPVQGSTPEDTLKKQTMVMVRPLPARIGGYEIPPVLRRLVAEMLHKRPESRPESAAEVWRSLRLIEKLVGEVPVVAPAIGSWTMVVQPEEARAEGETTGQMQAVVEDGLEIVGEDTLEDAQASLGTDLEMVQGGAPSAPPPMPEEGQPEGDVEAAEPAGAVEPVEAIEPVEPVEAVEVEPMETEPEGAGDIEEFMPTLETPMPFDQGPAGAELQRLREAAMAEDRQPPAPASRVQGETVKWGPGDLELPDEADEADEAELEGAEPGTPGREATLEMGYGRGGGRPQPPPEVAEARESLAAFVDEAMSGVGAPEVDVDGATEAGPPPAVVEAAPVSPPSAPQPPAMEPDPAAGEQFSPGYAALDTRGEDDVAPGAPHAEAPLPPPPESGGRKGVWIALAVAVVVAGGLTAFLVLGDRGSSNGGHEVAGKNGAATGTAKAGQGGKAGASGQPDKAGEPTKDASGGKAGVAAAATPDAGAATAEADADSEAAADAAGSVEDAVAAGEPDAASEAAADASAEQPDAAAAPDVAAEDVAGEEPVAKVVEKKVVRAPDTPVAPTAVHTVTLKSDPSGASVLDGAFVIGETPLTLRVDEGRTRKLTLERRGYAPANVELTSDAGEVAVELKKPGK